jgi:hypothetical protein
MQQAEAIRRLFLSAKSDYSIREAATILGWPTKTLRAELSSQYLVPENAWRTTLVPWTAVAVLGMGEWSHLQIEQALGTQASILPPLVRMTQIVVTLPAYQVAALQSAARRAAGSADELISHSLMDLVTDEACELSSSLPGFREAFHWPTEAGAIFFGRGKHNGTSGSQRNSASTSCSGRREAV